jgi:hypothetical protein
LANVPVHAATGDIHGPVDQGIFTAYTEEGQGERRSALACLSLAQETGAHLTIQAAAMRYAVPPRSSEISASPSSTPRTAVGVLAGASRNWRGPAPAWPA